MNQDVRFIKITFENIDYIIIPVHYFFDFELSDVRTTVRRAAANAILRYCTANSVSFILRPEADRDAPQFDSDLYTISTNSGGLFDRLYRPDIVALTLIYADGTQDEYLTPWEDEANNEFRNRLQTTSPDDNGMLCVQIGRNIV